MVIFFLIKQENKRQWYLIFDVEWHYEKISSLDLCKMYIYFTTYIGYGYCEYLTTVQI